LVHNATFIPSRVLDPREMMLMGREACHGWRVGQILQLRADAHVMSECSDQEEVPPVVTLDLEPTCVYP
jgi:hypothetical protein